MPEYDLKKKLANPKAWLWLEAPSLKSKIRSIFTREQMPDNTAVKEVSVLLISLLEEKKLEQLRDWLNYLEELKVQFSREPESVKAVNEALAIFRKKEAFFRTRRRMLKIGAAIGIGAAAEAVYEYFGGFGIIRWGIEEEAFAHLQPMAESLLKNNKQIQSIHPRFSINPKLLKDNKKLKEWLESCLNRYEALSKMSYTEVSMQVGIFTSSKTTGLKVVNGEMYVEKEGPFGQVLLLPAPWERYAIYISSYHVLTNLINEKSKPGYDHGIEINPKLWKDPQLESKEDAFHSLYPSDYQLLAWSEEADLAMGLVFLRKPLSLKMPSFTTNISPGEVMIYASSISPWNTDRPPLRVRLLAKNPSYLLGLSKIFKGYSGSPLVSLDGRIAGILHGSFEKLNHDFLEKTNHYTIDISLSATHIREMFEAVLRHIS